MLGANVVSATAICRVDCAPHVQTTHTRREARSRKTVGAPGPRVLCRRRVSHAGGRIPRKVSHGGFAAKWIRPAPGHTGNHIPERLPILPGAAEEVWALAKGVGEYSARPWRAMKKGQVGVKPSADAARRART